MDVKKKARYEKWKRDRIGRRIVFLGIGLLLVLLVFGWMISSCNHADSDTNRSFHQGGSGFEPRVYLFNAHPLEMIGSSFHNLFEGEMSIVELTHVLADQLESHGISTLVEHRSVDDVLTDNGWGFYMSYYAARPFVLDAMAAHSSLEFFIDLHRDGIPLEYATVEINGQAYARILFVVGTDNPEGYAESYAVARELHYLLEERKPGISRGIFRSGGSGRDGVYSQDISPMLVVIELGTVETTVEEAERTVEVLAEVLAAYLMGAADEDSASN